MNLFRNCIFCSHVSKNVFNVYFAVVVLNSLQVWSLEQPEWTCKIDEGSAGLISARWSPDGRHILTTAEFHLRITVWSLVTKSVSYIKYPKEAKQGMVCILWSICWTNPVITHTSNVVMLHKLVNLSTKLNDIIPGNDDIEGQLEK